MRSVSQVCLSFICTVQESTEVDVFGMPRRQDAKIGRGTETEIKHYELCKTIFVDDITSG